jgi:hypothetical protein
MGVNFETIRLELKQDSTLSFDGWINAQFATPTINAAK